MRESERKVEGKIGATFSRKGRGGCNERWGKTEGRERERDRKREKEEEQAEMKSETAVTCKRRGRKTGDSGREWTVRAISGGD